VKTFVERLILSIVVRRLSILFCASISYVAVENKRSRTACYMFAVGFCYVKI
jgi:hypothetical protein